MRFFILPATTKFYQMTLPSTSAQEIIGRFHCRQGADKQRDNCGWGFVCFSLPIISSGTHIGQSLQPPSPQDQLPVNSQVSDQEGLTTASKSHIILITLVTACHYFPEGGALSV